jgi:hypothetical protein
VIAQMKETLQEGINAANKFGLAASNTKEQHSPQQSKNLILRMIFFPLSLSLSIDMF